MAFVAGGIIALLLAGGAVSLAVIARQQETIDSLTRSVERTRTLTVRTSRLVADLRAELVTLEAELESHTADNP